MSEVQTNLEERAEMFANMDSPVRRYYTEVDLSRIPASSVEGQIKAATALIGVGVNPLNDSFFKYWTEEI